MYRHINPTRWTSWQYPISCCRYRSSAQHLPLKTSMIHLDAVKGVLGDPSCVGQSEMVTVQEFSIFCYRPQRERLEGTGGFGDNQVQMALF